MYTVCELRRQAAQLGVPVVGLSVKMVLERLIEITGTGEEDENKRREPLTSSQRVSVMTVTFDVSCQIHMLLLAKLVQVSLDL